MIPTNKYSIDVTKPDPDGEVVICRGSALGQKIAVSVNNQGRVCFTNANRDSGMNLLFQREITAGNLVTSISVLITIVALLVSCASN